TGDAITFCTPGDEYYVRKIEKLIRQQIPVANIPEQVFIEETPYEERQAIAREIDMQKRKENPEFKGAFHEKKFQKPPAKKPAAGNRTPAGKKSHSGSRAKRK
ncbi:MAG TPA: ATP-dependent helicase, partial [Sphingobacteriaceae bacterium]